MKTRIREGHHVRSADGSMYSVSYVDEPRQEAHLFSLADSTYIDLPLSELTRVAKTKLPPIEGMPEKRPHCPTCGKPLQPRVDRAHERSGGPQSHFTGRITRRTFTGWRGYRIERGNAFDGFCTLGCARTFANAAYKAGYRIKRKDTP